ncbi:MAG: hypothetical protein HKM95_11740 [Inquilinus sp.]|nr:hypothetical protein [Inquilinus sp.]
MNGGAIERAAPTARPLSDFPPIGARVWIRAVGVYGTVAGIMDGQWTIVRTVDNFALRVVPEYLIVVGGSLGGAVAPGGEA